MNYNAQPRPSQGEAVVKCQVKRAGGEAGADARGKSNRAAASRWTAPSLKQIGAGCKPVLITEGGAVTSARPDFPKSITKGKHQTLMPGRSFGTDTIRLFAPVEDVTFRPGFDAEIQEEKRNATGEQVYDYALARQTDGKTVRGRMIKANTGDFQLSVKPAKQPGRSICILQFSAAAFEPNNLYPLDASGVERAARFIQDALEWRGILWELNAAQIVTLAMTRNLLLSEPPSNYLPILASLGIKKRARKVDYGDTGLQVGNKQWEAVFYGKEGEMRAKGHDQTSCPANLLRGEFTCKKGATSFNATGARTLPELIERWDGIKPAYRNAMKREIFKPENDAAAAPDRPAFPDWEGLLRATADSKRPFHAFKNMAGLMAVVESVGLQRAKYMVQTEQGDTSTKVGRTNLARVFKELEAAATCLEMQKKSSSGKRRQELYSELRAAVLDD